MQLVIGNKNYSSWSLRPWLLMQHLSVSFEERKLWLFTEQMKAQMQQVSQSLKVPVLIDNGLTIWDSLAICEYLNDQYLRGEGWPQQIAAKAQARSICAEMHAGFFAVREEMPMNVRREKAAIVLSDQANTEIQRIITIFSQCLDKSKEGDSATEYLFGDFSIADAFFMPIVIRFSIYQIQVPENVKQYMQHMLSLPAYKIWQADAIAETAVIAVAEV